MNTNQNASDRNQRRTTNLLLCAIAGLLGYNALSQAGIGAASTALAQPSGEEGLVSAAEQRKVIIAELRGMTSRMERLESVLAKGISVKVTDMPAVRLADPSQVTEPREPKRAAK
jgi:hypothetical protein